MFLENFLDRREVVRRNVKCYSGIGGRTNDIGGATIYGRIENLRYSIRFNDLLIIVLLSNALTQFI